MIRFIAGIRSPKHLAASWPDVRGSGGEAEVGWPVGQWGQLQESSLPPQSGRLWEGRAQEDNTGTEEGWRPRGTPAPCSGKTVNHP